MWLEGKHVLLTGATRGIGRALAGQMIAAGASVLAVARDSDALAALVLELGPQLQTYTCDLNSAAERQGLIQAAIGGGAQLDGLINNAGIQTEVDYLAPNHGGLADDLADDLAGFLAAEITVNLVAPLHLCAALAPHLALRPKGFVVNVTSALALAPKQAAPVYCATKAGLRSFTTGLRYQARQSAPGLQISECIMALVDTGMTQGRGRGKIGPEQAARELLQGVRRGADEIWIGKTKALRWIHRLSPSLAARILRGKPRAPAPLLSHHR